MRGLDLNKQESDRASEDYVFGGFSQPCIAEIPEDERLDYLPDGELQNIGEEKTDCASRGPVNILEAKFNFLYRNNLISEENKKWLERYYVYNDKILFSDRFIAILSGTDPESGNSMKAPLQAIHTYGLIPKSLFPQVESRKEYYDKHSITTYMEKMGNEFLKRFSINYELVKPAHLNEFYKQDMLIMAGHAWPVPVNGEYPRTEDDINHLFIGVSKPVHTIFDNYQESEGDFIKKLSEDYILYKDMYRVKVTENELEPLTFFGKIKQFICDTLIW